MSARDTNDESNADVREAIDRAQSGGEGIATGPWALLFKALFAGWIVAGVVWLDHAARDSVTRFLLVYLAFYAISALGLYHVVVTAADAMYLISTGAAGVLPSVLGFGCRSYWAIRSGGLSRRARRLRPDRRRPHSTARERRRSTEHPRVAARSGAGRSRVPVGEETSDE
jgi:hypothetical protein